MEGNRYQRWVHSSHGLAKIGGPAKEALVWVVQKLGRLDCQLISEDERFRRLSQEEKETIEESILLTDRDTLSYLWVLGAYELVRTLDQRCRDDKTLLPDNLANRIRKLKHRIARLRIPLAKMEPAKKYRGDDPIAWPAIHPEHGTAWRVAPDTFITRRQISDDLLELVEAIRNSQETTFP